MAQYDLCADSPEQILNAAVKAIGALDTIFLNSGTASGRDFKIWQEMKETLDVNVMGTSHFFLESIKYFSKEDRPAVIAVNTSIAGLRGLSQSTIYGASKAYLITLCQSLRMRLRKKRSKIKIVDIRPGFVDTKMSGGAFWVAPAPKAAKQIIRAMDRGQEIVYVTRRWILVAILIRIVPRFIYERI
jgi:short-subunit dehydrogenase